MKKLLSLLCVLTISGTTMPMVIAASPYQKQETKKLIRIKKAIDEETQIPLPEIENVQRENQITLTRNDINIISRPEWNPTDFIIQLSSDIVRRIGRVLSREQIISLLSTFIGSLTADFCSTYLSFPLANTAGATAGYCIQTEIFRNLIKKITTTIIEMSSSLINSSSFFVPVSLNSSIFNSQVLYSPVYGQYDDEESTIEFAGRRRVQSPSLTSLENWSNYEVSEVRINMSILETGTEENTTITILDKTNLASLTFRKEL